MRTFPIDNASTDFFRILLFYYFVCGLFQLYWIETEGGKSGGERGDDLRQRARGRTPTGTERPASLSHNQALRASQRELP